MCIICVDLDKGKLTPWEAAKNRTEMIGQLDAEHLEVLNHKISDSLTNYLNDLNNKNEKEQQNIKNN